MVNDDREADQGFQVLTQVLEAEKHAQSQVDDARTQAETILQDAQNNARGIATRTDKRIQALHGRFRENLARKKSEFGKAFQRERGARATAIGADTVKGVTSRLARNIVGVAQE